MENFFPETREDEEQGIKMQEIAELLVAAGYFRARIKGLSAFDKVVGGMVWAIELCAVDIDVDLLFQENLNIGQKIALTEKIVAVLPKMKCPHRIEPHQIQGLDFIHIFPVIQWLVKKAIETREETGDYNRAYAVSQFEKKHKLPQDVTSNQQEIFSTVYRELKEMYRPKRKYRHQARQQIKEEKLQVQSTLLEYGRHPALQHSGKSQEGPSRTERSESVDYSEDQEQELQSIQQSMKTLMSGMSPLAEHEGKLTASTVGSLVEMKSAEIQQIVEDYETKQPVAPEYRDKLGGLNQNKRIMASLTKQLELKKQQLNEVEERANSLQQQYEEKKNKLKEVQDQYIQITDDIKKIEELEDVENKSVLKKIGSLVAMAEELKNQENVFKQHCRDELVRLQKPIEELQNSQENGSSEDQEQSELVEQQYQTDKEKLQRMRVLLARRNREIAALQRKIDEVPSRAELSQYQRRFVELYTQVAATHKETKQFYTLYNTLDDIRMYLAKEIGLLNSILENFSDAMTSATTKDQFLAQFEQIVEGVKQNRIKVEKRRQEAKMSRDQLHDQYLDLVEKQRLYFKTVKEFKEECRKNEILVGKLKERS